MDRNKEHPTTYKVIGLMSGSSLDGLDIAYGHFSIARDDPDPLKEWAAIQAETAPYTTGWQQRLKQLPAADGRELAKAHAAFGRYIAELVRSFLQRHHIQPDLIASHGHTIFHYPSDGFTLQIGDGAALSAHTGYPVVCDFRAQDIALGGEGAPLAPIADKWLFPGYDFYLNLGGIANLSGHANGRYIAFDISGANQVLNALAQLLGHEYDAGGKIAAEGRVVPGLLQQANSLPYLAQSYPKSLGNDWVQEHLLPLFLASPASVEDKLHTACLHVAQQTALAVETVRKRENLSCPEFRLLATGGGVFNGFLMQCIEEECRKHIPVHLTVPSDDIVSFKEALMIGLMGVLRINHLPNCLASVTGAKRDVVAGAVYV